MALSQSTFGNAAGSVSDLFGGIGDLYKASGDRDEAASYGEAATLAGENAQYTATSTAIKLTQANRQIYQSLSNTQAEAAGSGLADSGSVKDILADSAQQGELHKQVLQQQGIITEEGYKEQQQADLNQEDAANKAATGADIAGVGSFISGAVKGLAAVASIAAVPATGGLSLAGLSLTGTGGLY